MGEGVKGGKVKGAKVQRRKIGFGSVSQNRAKQVFKCDSARERHHAVAACPQGIGPGAVQWIGHPINHETNAGFSRRRETGPVDEDVGPCGVIGSGGEEERCV